MRYLLLACLIATAACAEERKAEAPAPNIKMEPAGIQLTADDLQNLVVCARRQLPSLTADEIAGVAQSIKHAEAAIAAMRTPPEPPKAAEKDKAK